MRRKIIATTILLFELVFPLQNSTCLANSNKAAVHRAAAGSGDMYVQTEPEVWGGVGAGASPW